MLIQLSIYAAAGFAAAVSLTLALKAAALRRSRCPVQETPRFGGQRRVLLLLGGAALSLGLAACGKAETDETEPQADEAGSGSAAETQTETAGDETTVPAEESADDTAAAHAETDPSPASDGKPVHITGKEHFAQVTAEGRVLVDFYADWCGPCQALAPILKDIASEKRQTLTVAKVDVDDHRDLAGEHGVRGIPHLVLFKNGKAVDSMTGFRSKKALNDWLN